MLLTIQRVTSHTPSQHRAGRGYASGLFDLKRLSPRDANLCRTGEMISEGHDRPSPFGPPLLIAVSQPGTGTPRGPSKIISPFGTKFASRPDSA